MADQAIQPGRIAESGLDQERKCGYTEGHVESCRR